MTSFLGKEQKELTHKRINKNMIREIITATNITTTNKVCTLYTVNQQFDEITPGGVWTVQP